MSALTDFESLKQQIVEVVTKDPTVKYIFMGWVHEQFAEKVDLDKVLQEIRDAREASDRHFEEMHQESNRRFEEQAAETRQLREETKALRESSDKRWEESNQRFEELIKEMNHRFEAMDQRFDTMDNRFDKMQSSVDHVNLTVGGLQVRAGKNLERTVASVLRFGLNNPDIKPESLKLRQKIVDQEGLIGKPGKQYEYDLLPCNGEYFVIEIRSGGGAKREDIERLCEKAELAQHQRKWPSVKKVFVTLGKTSEVIKACEELEVILIA